MADELGLMCPNCHCPLVPEDGQGQRSVYYTRAGVRCIRRRRVCWHCGKRFSTTERVIGNDDEIPSEN